MSNDEIKLSLAALEQNLHSRLDRMDSAFAARFDRLDSEVKRLDSEVKVRFERLEVRMQAWELRQQDDMKAINAGFRRIRLEADLVEAKFAEIYERIERLENR
jgi:predicted phage-related endonuclease